jgi:hypothetical protein
MSEKKPLEIVSVAERDSRDQEANPEDVVETKSQDHHETANIFQVRKTHQKTLITMFSTDIS